MGSIANPLRVRTSRPRCTPRAAPQSRRRAARAGACRLWWGQSQSTCAGTRGAEPAPAGRRARAAAGTLRRVSDRTASRTTARPAADDAAAQIALVTATAAP
eukprot:487771-Prymnesium_polylepis.2